MYLAHADMCVGPPGMHTCAYTMTDDYRTHLTPLPPAFNDTRRTSCPFPCSLPSFAVDTTGTAPVLLILHHALIRIHSL